MRFGRHSAQAAETLVETDPPRAAPLGPIVRQARKDGQLIAVIRAVDHGSAHVVEAEVFPRGSMQAIRPGPYSFQDAHEATAFMTEVVAALIYLGCEVQAPDDAA